MRLFPQGIVALAFLAISTAPTFAVENTAKPDPSLVARYEANNGELLAKMAECKKKGDLAAILTDVTCMSADEVMKRRTRQQLASKCRVGSTFVFVPRELKGTELEKYLLKHAPSDEALRNCGQSKDEWLKYNLARASKK